jgi:hypothetical protein
MFAREILCSERGMIRGWMIVSFWLYFTGR